MLRGRVIPCLLLRNGGLVKTRRFKDAKYVGDPINAIRIFNEKEVDELVVLDIAATREGRRPDFSLVEQFAGECFMPLCYGGGVRTVADARLLISLGVEKICVQTAALENPEIIGDIAGRLGAQSVVVAVDVKRNWRGNPRLYRSTNGRFDTRPWAEHMRSLVKQGAGEVIVTAVDREGTMNGVDLELVRTASDAVQVPVIASGGVGSLQDIASAVNAGASGVAVGSFFVFSGPHRAVLITYPTQNELDSFLSTK